jgi:hypothetical protein
MTDIVEHPTPESVTSTVTPSEQTDDAAAQPVTSTATPEQTDDTAAPPEFIPAERFDGGKKGYVFAKRGDQVGYFKDVAPVVVKKKMTPPTAPSFLKPSATQAAPSAAATVSDRKMQEMQRMLAESKRKKEFNETWGAFVKEWTAQWHAVSTEAHFDVQTICSGLRDLYLQHTTQPSYIVKQYSTIQGVKVWDVEDTEERCKTPGRFVEARVPIRRMKEKMHHRATFANAEYLLAPIGALLLQRGGAVTFGSETVTRVVLVGKDNSKDKVPVVRRGRQIAPLVQLMAAPVIMIETKDVDGATAWWLVELTAEQSIKYHKTTFAPPDKVMMPTDLAMFRSRDTSSNKETWDAFVRMALQAPVKKKKRRKRKKKKKNTTATTEATTEVVTTATTTETTATEATIAN